MYRELSLYRPQGYHGTAVTRRGRRVYHRHVPLQPRQPLRRVSAPPGCAGRPPAVPVVTAVPGGCAYWPPPRVPSLLLHSPIIRLGRMINHTAAAPGQRPASRPPPQPLPCPCHTSSASPRASTPSATAFSPFLQIIAQSCAALRDAAHSINSSHFDVADFAPPCYPRLTWLGNCLMTMVCHLNCWACCLETPTAWTKAACSKVLPSVACS